MGAWRNGRRTRTVGKGGSDKRTVQKSVDYRGMKG